MKTTPEQEKTLATLPELADLNIAQLAKVCLQDWKKVYFGAVPYLREMRGMSSVDDMVGCESGKSVVLYFLCNASTWRGPIAKLVKAELNRRVGK